MRPIRWNRGLLRLWVVFCVVWTLGFVWVVNPFQSLSELKDAGMLYERAKAEFQDASLKLESETVTHGDGLQLIPVDLEEQMLKAEAVLRASTRMYDSSQNRLAEQGIVYLAVPLSLLVLGALMVWALRGFRENEH